jgi:hypothetical protein
MISELVVKIGNVMYEVMVQDCVNMVKQSPYGLQLSSFLRMRWSGEGHELLAHHSAMAEHFLKLSIHNVKALEL